METPRSIEKIIFGVQALLGAPSIPPPPLIARLAAFSQKNWLGREELGQARKMDELLAEVGGGGSGIGLNIVCDAPAAASSTTGLASGGGAGGNKRRKNKYEKRRAKARQAREEKERQKLMAFVPAADQPTSRSDAAVAVDGDKVASSERGAVDEQNESSDAGADADEDNNEDKAKRDTPNNGSEAIGESADDASDASASEASGVESESENDDDSPAPSPAPPSSSGAPQKISRRVHDAALLDDERKRADYMATFHARPHEIDRRSNASSRIKESRASNHIFEADDDEEDDGTNSSDKSHSDGDVGDNDEATELEDKQDEQISAPKGPFEAIGLHPRLANAVSSERGFGYDRPTIIQTNAARALISTNQSGGKKAKKQKTSGDKLPNLFVQSETGSGKTLAYLLPIVQSLAVDSATNDLKKVDRQIGGTRCIILCPTRELATQTATMAEKLCLKSFNWLVPGCLSGGEKRKSEKARLRKGVSILVATPGRLLDHITKTDCLLMSLKGKLEWLVLDEADRLLDMGLGGQVETIVQHIRANQPRSGIKRDGITWRSVLVSATVTPKIEVLAKKSLGGDTWVWARAKKGKGGRLDNDEGGDELAHSAPKQLAQLHLTCSAKLRLPTLVAFLTARVQKGERIVVFMSTCDGVEFYHALFAKMGCILPRDNDKDDGNSDKDGLFGDACSMFRLHGNVPHAERQTILKKFGTASTKKASILFATDVAARGLNLPGLDWIVQYDAPCETADYVHRAGRAARAGKAGHALLFLLPSEKQFLEVLEIRGMKEMSALSLSATLNGAADICGELTADGVKRSGGGYGSGSGSRSGEAFAAAIQNKLEECIVEDEVAYKDNLRKSLTEQRKTKGANKILKNAIGELHEAAIKAYSAHIRSYPAKEKAVRHIFSPRALHLGHIARSFALKEQPKALSGKRRAAEGSDDEDEDILKSTGRKRNARLAFGGKRKLGDDSGDGKEAATKSAGAGKRAKKKKSLAESSDITALDDIMKSPKKKKGKFSNKATDFGFGHGDKQSAGANQKRMLAMAQKMQGSGLSEFF